MPIMTARERLGLNASPLLLRLMLGGIVLWAGLAKLLDTADVQGERAAILGNMGVLTPTAKSVVTTPPPPAADAPATHQAAPPPIIVPTRGRYTAADFPDTVKVQRLYLTAITLHDAAHPKAAVPPGTPESAPAPPPVTPSTTGASGASGPAAPATAPPPAGPMPTWHPALADGPWSVYFAWGVAIIQAAGGACLLIGLLTRFWALGIAAVMLGALWLTDLGPAIQTGHTRWGFLPDYAAFDATAWRPLVFHFALFMSALALAFLGPGRASLDAMLFGPRRE